MLNLDICRDFRVESAYIITLPGHELSETLSQRCQQSCQSVGMPFRVWEAFDGTDNQNIRVPEHSRGKDWLNWIKWRDPELSMSEVATAFSHISLWAHCATIDKPIVILEHDAIMDKLFDYHPCHNAIVYLGCGLQKFEGWGVESVPIFGSKGHNYRFIYKAHAYSIEPNIAKNMLSHVIKMGIHESLDIMIRSDIFSIIQTGLYAYDLPHEQTTITHRKKKEDGSER